MQRRPVDDVGRRAVEARQWAAVDRTLVDPRISVRREGDSAHEAGRDAVDRLGEPGLEERE